MNHALEFLLLNIIFIYWMKICFHTSNNMNVRNRPVQTALEYSQLPLVWNKWKPTSNAISSLKRSRSSMRNVQNYYILAAGIWGISMVIGLDESSFLWCCNSKAGRSFWALSQTDLWTTSVPSDFPETFRECCWFCYAAEDSSIKMWIWQTGGDDS